MNREVYEKQKGESTSVLNTSEVLTDPQNCLHERTKPSAVDFHLLRNRSIAQKPRPFPSISITTGR